MEESFTDVDDWRSIIELSEDELGQIFEDEGESFFKKVESFKLDLDSDISGPGMDDNLKYSNHSIAGHAWKTFYRGLITSAETRAPKNGMPDKYSG